MLKITKQFQAGALNVYRVISFAVLSSIILGVIGYVFFLLFYLLNSSWAAPITLSPSQDKVLTFQPQVANLEAMLAKQSVDLETNISKAASARLQLDEVNNLLRRVSGAQASEASALRKSNTELSALLVDKHLDIKSTGERILEVREMQASIDAELKAGLITRDQAQARRISLQGALNAATDARALAIQLQEQARQVDSAARTLSGGSSSLMAMQSLQEALQLKTLAAQLTIDMRTAESTAESLKGTIAESQRVLQVAKVSPYYKARTEPVTALFTPYQNVDAAKIGAKVYDCYLQVIACHEVGEVLNVYEAEEYARHPLFKTDLKGRLVQVRFSDPDAAQSQVVFIGGKPLFL